jgi:DNA-binding NarL/FixJ family response regulator
MNPLFKKSVGIIEDNLSFRNNISKFIELSNKYDLAFSIGNLGELVMISYKPDFILLDIHLNGENSLDTLSVISSRFPKSNIVIMTGDTNSSHILTSYKYGATGFIYKPFYLQDVIDVIDQITDHGCYLPPIIAKKLVNIISSKKVDVQEKYDLSIKELEIINLIRLGLSYKEMADKLNVTTHAINYHTKNIYFKMDVNSKSKLLARLSD